MNYFFTHVDEISETTNFKRVGIVPFFIENGTLHFFLMIDSKFQELTDCGGLPKENESWIETSIRETEEESRGTFIFDRGYLSKFGMVYWREDYRIAIIFVDITSRVKNCIKAESVCHRYRISYLRGIENRDKRDRLENSDMHFYTEGEIRGVWKSNGKMYIPVKRLFQKFFYQGLQNKLINNLTVNTKISVIH